MSFFGVGGNPFATQVGSKIEKATQESLPTEDWGVNLEICDIINNSEEGPRDAMKAIRKRLSSNPKNGTVIKYTLTVLETCVKNCGRRFHILACSKDFIQELVKLIGPKNDPPMEIQDKVLALIQCWSEAFRHQPDLSGVSQVYADLKQKGVEFPPPSVENSVPLVSLYRPTSVSPSSQPPSHPPSSSYPVDNVDHSSGPVLSLSAEQKTKLASELSIVESNTKVLSEMLNELTPGNEQPDDLQLLKDLYATCRSMQDRVVDLVGRIDDDILIADILRINDDLNNIFVRYERHMSKHKGAGAPKKVSPESQGYQPPQEAALIDLGPEETPKPPIRQLQNMAIANKIEETDFDSFAQSRTSYDQQGAKSNDSSKNDETISKDQSVNEFDEMEKWLKQDAGNNLDQRTVSSSDFDRFLAERAAVADTLPIISAATGSVSAAGAGSETSAATGSDPAPGTGSRS